MAALRAAVVAEVAEVGGGEDVGRAAAQAVLRVGSVLELAARVARVVEPEDAGVGAVAAEVAHLRVVAVDHESRIGELAYGCTPARGHHLELAVAVELITKKVPEQQR